MAGVDTVRGIGYQQASAVLLAVEVLDDDAVRAIRVEGTADVVDVELWDADENLIRGLQYKTRRPQYTWSALDILSVIDRWRDASGGERAEFDFVTDGRLGPSAEMLVTALDRLQGAGNAKRELITVGVELCTSRGQRQVEALRRANIRVAAGSVEQILGDAEWRTATMIPDTPARDDLRERARAGVDSLFRRLFDTASQPEPEDRILDRAAIAQILGVASDNPVGERWNAEKAQRYAAAILAVDVVVPAVLRVDGQSGEDTTSVEALANGACVIVSGRTGTGKTSLVAEAVAVHCRTDAVWIPITAEAYVPGRLAATVANSVSEVLDARISIAAAKLLLSQPSTTLVIDDASEASPAERRALADDLKMTAMSSTGARVVLVGRDQALMREMLPRTAKVQCLTPAPFDTGQLRALVRHALRQPELDEPGCDAVGRQIEDLLPGATSNPLLTTMVLRLIETDTTLSHFDTRASLYVRFIDHLAQRSGGASLAELKALLGYAFTELLNDGRRFADADEWSVLLASARDVLVNSGLTVDVSELNSVAHRIGLLNRIGYAQRVVPMHDSFADFLSGYALARNYVKLPTSLVPSDEQRLLFCSELGGLNDSEIVEVARSLPFLLPDLCNRILPTAGTADLPMRCATLLAALLPAGVESGVILWRGPTGSLVAGRTSEYDSRWAEERPTVNQSQDGLVLVGRETPCDVAEALWRLYLGRSLRRPARAQGMRFASASEVAAAIAIRTTQTKQVLTSMVATLVNERGQGQVLAALGPLGLRAIIEPRAADPFGGTYWPVSYVPADDVAVTPRDEAGREGAIERAGHGTHESFLRDDPETAAGKRLRTCLNSLTKMAWL